MPHGHDDPTTDSSGQILSHEDAPTLDAGIPRREISAHHFPERIGNYRILGKLGEGGMGIVFEAEQDSPKRRVALKVVRGGAFLDESQVRLFQREVDTLARLRHPNIGAIYDAGRTEAGEHFFAMELVRGQTLGNYMRGRAGAMDTREIRFRLRLFQSICAAVNYAHQRGVIHRDLKPSNIIVSDVDGAERSGTLSGALPEIKILDFGLARITDSDVEAATAISEIGVIKGTLPYMSPEQTRGNPAEVDVRSDVYSLGVLLYEMLTGARPYDTHNTSIMEAVRVICEQPPLSLRQAWKGPGTPDQDLLTITGKALEKEADRRYGSAAALAEDIERYLDSRPITARAPSSIYQLSKFARRNRTLVIGAAATLVALIAGVIASTTFGLREATQRRAAEQAQKDTQAVAEFQESMLTEIDAQKMGRRLSDDLATRIGEARREAGATPAQVAGALAGFRASMDEINTTDAALRVIDENILERALQTARTRFAKQPVLQAQLLRSIASTYFKIGLYDKVEAPLLAARALYDSAAGPTNIATLQTVRQLAELYNISGRNDEAEPLFATALAGFRRTLGAEDREVWQTMNSMALIYNDTGRAASAESLYAIALAGQQKQFGDDDIGTVTIQHNFAWVLTEDNKFAKAESLSIIALAARRRLLGNEHPETMSSVNNLAVLYVKTNQLDKAEPLYREDFETSRRLLGEEHPDLLVSMTNLGRFYNRVHKYREAEALLTKALITSRKVLPLGFIGTGITALASGEALIGLERYHDAEPRLLEAHKILSALRGPDDPGVQRAVTALVEVYTKTGATAAAARWRGRISSQD